MSKSKNILKNTTYLMIAGMFLAFSSWLLTPNYTNAQTEDDCRIEQECELEPVTVNVEKVICEEEADLPNWANGNTTISSNTATDWVNSSNGDCAISDWVFQMSLEGSVNPGDGVATAGSPWISFSDSIDINWSDITADGEINVREVYDFNYIEFSGINSTDDYSAEMYCDSDVSNYDNFETIYAEPGEEFYCVAFNVPIDVEDIGDVVDDSGEVLGDTDGEVLAETGNPALLTFISGVLIVTIAAMLPKLSKGEQ